MVDASFRIDLNTTLGIISPRLYGQFAEHLGRCCYDGFWVGRDNQTLPHQDGLRLDVIEALKRMSVPLLRWPGGCYADHYHWRDGIGPAHERPRRLGMSCGITVEDDNGMGTHEFLRLCQLLGAEPYLAGNVGTGSPQELCDWLEYCNSAVDTTLTRERTANGSPAPFRVPLWGVGNENWGCGGHFDAVSYANEYCRYATMLRHVDSAADLVVCGFDDDWNIELLRTIGRRMHLVDHLSVHRYWIGGGPELDFSEQEYYALLAEAQATEDFVRRTAEIIQSETDGNRRIGIALDEWGVWHPESRTWGPGEVERRSLDCGYEQAGTLRDALAAAVALEGFQRQCSVLTLANLAQTVNVLHAVVLTQGNRLWLTPTYYVFVLHQPHIGATALSVGTERGSALPDGSSVVSAAVSSRGEGVAITLINRHFSQAQEVEFTCESFAGQAHGQVLTASSPKAMNTADNPNQVGLTDIAVKSDGAHTWRVDLPPHSVATVRLSA